jgi:hypothetical protein
MAMLAVLSSLVAIAPTSVMAACHVGPYYETQKTNTYTKSSGNTTTSTSRVRWRYKYDCSWAITGVEVDWRRVTLTVRAPDLYVCCYARDLVSFHLIAKNNPIEPAYPSYAACQRDTCTFGPWTDDLNVHLSYTPSAWNAQYSPHTRMSCTYCTPAGSEDMAQDYWFVHGKSEIVIVT